MDINYFDDNLTVTDIFETVKNEKSAVYDFDTEECMDNICAMGDFVNAYIPEENMDLDDGTQCFIVHEDYDFMIVLDCGGRGDFNTHRVDATWYKKIK